MPKPLHVVVPVLSGSAEDMSKAADWLRAELSPLDEFVNGLLGGSWSGDASTEYAKIWRQWHEGAESVASGLSKLAEWMGACASRYAQADGSGGA